MMQAKSVIILKANSGILKFGGGIKMLGVKILGWVGYWVVAVISVDAYPFLAFSDLTCHLEDTGIGLFRLHCPA